MICNWTAYATHAEDLLVVSITAATARFYTTAANIDGYGLHLSESVQCEWFPRWDLRVSELVIRPCSAMRCSAAWASAAAFRADTTLGSSGSCSRGDARAARLHKPT